MCETSNVRATEGNNAFLSHVSLDIYYRKIRFIAGYLPGGIG